MPDSSVICNLCASPLGTPFAFFYLELPTKVVPTASKYNSCFKKLAKDPHKTLSSHVKSTWLT